METEKLPGAEAPAPLAPVSNSTLSSAHQSAGIQQQLSIFFKKRLPGIFKTILVNPMNGINPYFTNPGEDHDFSMLVLMGLTFLLYVIVPYLMLGSAGRQFIGFGAMLALGLTVLFFLLLVSLMAFGIKAASGKASFKAELSNGGLCCVPLLLLLVMMVLAKIFSAGDNFLLTGSSLFSIFTSSGLIIALLSVYMFLMMINILLQSLRAGGIKDALSWYISPLIILLGFYVAIKVTSAFF